MALGRSVLVEADLADGRLVKRVEPAGAGLSALAEPSPSRTQWAFGRVSDAPIGSAEGFDLHHAVTLSVNARLCYRLRCLEGVVWEIPSNISVSEEAIWAW